MKKKLFAAAVSLMVAVVLLGGTSFAWFTVSNAPEVSEVKMTMEATKNLEIGFGTLTSGSLTAPGEVTAGDAATGESTWGGKVTSVFGAKINFPAFNDSGTLKTIAYDTSGRVQATATATTSVTMPTSWTAAVDGTNSIYGIATADVTNGPTGAKVAAVYPVWLRSNTDLTAVKATVSGTAALKAGGTAYTLATSGKTAADVVKVTCMTEASGTWTEVPSAGMSLTANTATLVYVVVYLDGDGIVAADVAQELTAEGLTVTFSDTAVDTFANQHSGT